MTLQNLRRTNSQPITFDGSRPLFRVGGCPRVSEFVQALPMLKADPAIGEAPNQDNSAFTMKITVSRMNTGVPAVPYYDNSSNLGAVVVGGLAASDYNIVRLGATFLVPTLDVRSIAHATSGDGLEWRMHAAASAVLQKLDNGIARDVTVAAGQPQRIAGLTQLSAGRTAFTSGDIEEDAREAISHVNPTGAGAGEGPHCLVVGRMGLKRLMATPSGQQGLSGWRIDKGTGMMIYHYMGMPVYRADIDETGSQVPPNSTRLYAINLGGTGLNLVHTVGTPDTFGLVCDEGPLLSGQREYVVHGAYGLVLWEVEAIYEITGIPLGR